MFTLKGIESALLITGMTTPQPPVTVDSYFGPTDSCEVSRIMIQKTNIAYVSIASSQDCVCA